ncbi:hypothetical protein Clacol_006106 [Clathrus columnatus]|uniref:Uncharacterized protein n=1 Tax=Clathrus columnatus TaxID=1419009 RepID=A0AAV5AED6_9AGAM|nr:hypothetical protein Clacol_006106 [Clathrus columnatus]
MDLLTDLEFLRQDNTTLLKEVQTLRQQSDLLRERSEELERRLRGHPVQNVSNAEQEKVRITLCDSKISKTETNDGGPTNTAPHPDTNVRKLPKTLSEPQIVIRSTQLQSPHISIAWDESPVERVAPAQLRDTRRFSGIFTSVQSGPHLIGEAPANYPINECFSPPSPASEPHRDIRIPSLRSVVPPVSGVALPNIAAGLLELRLIKKETYDTPAAVASFMHKLIPASHRDSLVSIVWPEPETGLRPPAKGNKCMDSSRRSRSMDPPHRTHQPPVLPPIMTDNTDIARLVTGPAVSIRALAASTKSEINKDNNKGVDDKKGHQNTNSRPKMWPRKEESITHCPPCERDAWVLLLALAYAAFPDSKVAKKMRRLPVTIRLQMIAWMPPGINVYANMEFASTTVDEALGQLWDSKKEILRLRNGWES